MRIPIRFAFALIGYRAKNGMEPLREACLRREPPAGWVVMLLSSARKHHRDILMERGDHMSALKYYERIRELSQMIVKAQSDAIRRAAACG